MRSAETFPGGTGTSPMSDKAVTVLPEPDSPTSPTIFPRPTVEGNILQHADMAAVAVEFGRRACGR